MNTDIGNVISEHDGVSNMLADAIIAKLRHPIVQISVDCEGELDCDLLSVETLVALLYEDVYDGVGLAENGAHEEAAYAWQATLDHVDDLIVDGSTEIPDDPEWIDSFWALRRDELIAWRTGLESN